MASVFGFLLEANNEGPQVIGIELLDNAVGSHKLGKLTDTLGNVPDSLLALAFSLGTDAVCCQSIRNSHHNKLPMLTAYTLGSIMTTTLCYLAYK